MKKYHYIYISLAVSAIIAAIPAIGNAQLLDTGAATSIGASIDNEQNNIPRNLPGAIREKLNASQADYQARIQNAENNRDYRNSLVEGYPRQGSSTLPHPSSGMPPREGDNGTSSRSWIGNPPPGVRPGTMSFASTSPWHDREFDNDTGRPLLPFLPLVMRRFASTSPMLASSTFVERVFWDRGRLQKERADAFALVQNRLVDQLTHALDNLKQIRGRIVSRIHTDSARADMTDALALLATADNDITAAGQAIQSLANYVPPANQGLTASTTVDLNQARQLGSAAIKAVNDARKALNDVVVAIAHSLGLKLGQDRDASTTPRSRPVVCTQDAKICPNGSAVGRVGPRCEFALCPGTVASSTTIQ